MTRRDFAASIGALPLVQVASGQESAIAIGSRRELLVDRELISQMRGVELRPCMPVDAGPAIHFDKPWEGSFCGYTTILSDKGSLRMTYRGVPVAGQDGNAGEVTCVAESTDGIKWSRPDLGIYELHGTRKNNVILANEPPYSHNFTPLIDTKPGIDPSMKYKALAGVHKTGLMAYVSADGLHWKKLQDKPVLPPPKQFSLDSQNISFWSAHEKKYVLYYRTWKKIGQTNYRWVSRAVSDDFINWTPEGEMSYGDAPPEHLYTNQTSAYFRAPHIYIGICARFMPGRQVLNTQQAQALRVDPKYFQDCSDAVLVTSRGGKQYTRTFLEAFLRPGVGLENWVSRSNYPALHLIQTAPATMSFYVNRNYGQPSAYLRRYELRLDGLASAHAGYSGGEFVTKPLVFDGAHLELNYSTSAPGSVRVELQDAAGNPLPGFTAGDATELIGDEVERNYAWKSGSDVSSLRGKPVRLRVLLKDADIYAFRFAS
jgi:hypothetical protein